MKERDGVVIWFTGPPSSGKSTLARAVAADLRDDGYLPVTLDGDEIRQALVPAPGYDDEARDAFYATLGRLASTLARQGHVVLVAATAHLRRYRARARSEAPRFVEVFLETPLEECKRRDAKGLYAAAQAERAAGVPGADVAYEPPLAPELRAGGRDDAAARARIRELVAALRASEPAR